MYNQMNIIQNQMWLNWYTPKFRAEVRKYFQGPSMNQYFVSDNSKSGLAPSNPFQMTKGTISGLFRKTINNWWMVAISPTLGTSCFKRVILIPAQESNLVWTVLYMWSRSSFSLMHQLITLGGNTVEAVTCTETKVKTQWEQYSATMWRLNYSTNIPQVHYIADFCTLWSKNPWKFMKR